MRVESGEWRVESGEWRVESGEGERRAESGEWKVGPPRRVESGECRVESLRLSPARDRHYMSCTRGSCTADRNIE